MEKADIKYVLNILIFICRYVVKSYLQPFIAEYLQRRISLIRALYGNNRSYLVVYMYKIGIKFAKKFTNTIDIPKKSVL